MSKKSPPPVVSKDSCPCSNSEQFIVHREIEPCGSDRPGASRPSGGQFPRMWSGLQNEGISVPPVDDAGYRKTAPRVCSNIESFGTSRHSAGPARKRATKCATTHNRISIDPDPSFRTLTSTQSSAAASVMTEPSILIMQKPQVKQRSSMTSRVKVALVNNLQAFRM